MIHYFLTIHLFFLLASVLIKFFIFLTIQQALFREVFFVNVVHRKPENIGAKSCKA